MNNNKTNNNNNNVIWKKKRLILYKKKSGVKTWKKKRFNQKQGLFLLNIHVKYLHKVIIIFIAMQHAHILDSIDRQMKIEWQLL